MAWLEIRLDATHEAIDWVKTLLVGVIKPQDLHITKCLGAELDTSESALESAVAWEFTILLYFPEDGQSRTKLTQVEQILSPLHRTGLTSEIQGAIVDEKLAIAPYLQQQVGERFLIVAPDSLASETNLELKELDPKIIPLIINPSMAFGSGLHPATLISLQMLERYVLPGMHTLDLGSGSGVLSVAMAKLGATVLALDNDPIAVQSTQEAIDRNQVSSKVLVQAGSLGKGNDLGHWLGGATVDQSPPMDTQGKFDLIMANIYARIHTALVGDYYQALRQKGNEKASNQGLLITTGFTTDQEEDVIIACRDAGFKLGDRLGRNDWVALVHYRGN